MVDSFTKNRLVFNFLHRLSVCCLHEIVTCRHSQECCKWFHIHSLNVQPINFGYVIIENNSKSNRSRARPFEPHLVKKLFIKQISLFETGTSVFRNTKGLSECVKSELVKLSTKCWQQPTRLIALLSE